MHTLNPEQEAALTTLLEFIQDDDQKVIVIDGMAGCGKTFLVNYFIHALAQNNITLKDLGLPYKNYNIVLTATTNKAAEALGDTTCENVITIHSALGLRVNRNSETNKTELVRSYDGKSLFNSIVVVDEASFVDEELKELIHDSIEGCKVIYMGDPAQLTPVNCNYSPVFSEGFSTIKLTQIMRQANGNPIQAFSVGLRDCVLTGKFPDVDLVPGRIEQLGKRDFLDELKKEMLLSSKSKFLAWTNKTVVEANAYISNFLSGNPILKVGDYAINNKYLTGRRFSIKTDQEVHISGMIPATVHGVSGHWITLSGYSAELFLPEDPSLIEKVADTLFKVQELDCLKVLRERWIDLRPAYACTINKSQGSTYDTVFIDLDDLNKCRDKQTKIRLLYVAVSRAKERVVMTGKFSL